jgi:hypothetical protein
MDIIVSIGRNVDGNPPLPLSEKDWLAYVTRVGEIVSRFGWLAGTGGFCTAGESFYTDKGKLVNEQSFTWGWTFNPEFNSLNGLRDDLTEIRHEYAQWGIAVTVGETEFV